MSVRSWPARPTNGLPCRSSHRHRSLTDEHQSGLGRAGAENGLRSRLGEVSALAAFSDDPGQGRQERWAFANRNRRCVESWLPEKRAQERARRGGDGRLRLARRPRQGCGGERLGREQAAFARGQRRRPGGSAAGIGGTAGVSAIAFSSGAAAAALRLGAGGFAGAGTRSSPARARDSSSCRSPRTRLPRSPSPLGKSGKIAASTASNKSDQTRPARLADRGRQGCGTVRDALVVVGL